MLQLLNAPRQDPSGVWGAYLLRVGMFAEGLRRRGCEVEQVHVCDLKSPARPVLAKLLGYKHLRHLAAGYDAIHAAGATPAAVAALAVRGTQVRLIYDVHGDAAMENWLMWQYTHQRSYIDQIFQQALMDLIAREKAHGLLVVSTPSYDRYIRCGISPQRLLLARNGADLHLFNALPFRPPDGVVRVCYSGSFVAWQGIRNLVRACRLLMQRGWPGSLRLRVIGFTSENASVREELSGVLGHRFEAVERVPYEEVPKVLTDADLMVIPRVPHPALRVAFPTKFGEYLACGRPVIVTDVDETADLVRRNGCGIVAEPNPSGLAAAFEQTAALPRQMILEMGARARDLAERDFSWDTIAGRYYEFLMGVLGRKP